LTGIKVLRSGTRNNSAGTANTSGDVAEIPGSSKRNGMRFPKKAVTVLRNWLDLHAENPYPSEAEKADLERVTELSSRQLADWLANARRRRKASGKNRPQVFASPSLQPTTASIPIPAAAERSWNELNPFERWKNSPPENEPASMKDIATAVANSDLHDDILSSSASTASKRRKGSSNGSGISQARAPSMTSQETGQTSSLSASSTAQSHGSSRSHGSFGSFRSSLAGKKESQRRRRIIASATGLKARDEQKRIFQCTFCTDTFKSKYDWTRHEKSLHLSLEKWMCCPSGPVAVDSANGNRSCSYCDLHNPSSDHIESHNHRQCIDKGADARTFYRKDHLRQHLRLMHGCELTPSMDAWKSVVMSINSRCGFCAQRFTMWQERVDHLTAHFKAGVRMINWKGCRGLDPLIAAQVTNSMPPYLIGIESVTPNPFSATNRSTWRACPPAGERSEPSATADALDQSSIAMSQAGTRATCWEILTIRLGRWAKQMAAQGTVMSDEMLQSQARQILYDGDDPWNQTAADNPQWLDLFKKAHGLDFIPSSIGGQGDCVPEDLETYGDLGLRIPFAVQLQAFNKSQANVRQQPNACNSLRGEFNSAVLSRRETLRYLQMQLQEEQVFYGGDQKCEHMECITNVVDVSAIDGLGQPGPKLRRWCSRELTPGKSDTLVRNIVVCMGNVKGSSQQRQADYGLRHDVFELPQQPQLTERQISPISSQNSGTISSSSTTRDMGRAQSLEVLARMEVSEVDTCAASRGTTEWQHSYFPTYRYELPADRAHQFATATGPWEASGVMPQPFTTAADHTHDNPVGEMMEFLGSDAYADLAAGYHSHMSFADQAAGGSELNAVSGGSATADDEIMDEALMRELNQFIDESTSGQLSLGRVSPASGQMDLVWESPAGSVPLTPSRAVVGGAGLAASAPMDMPAVAALDDVGFDDLTFDDVFDMPALRADFTE